MLNPCRHIPSCESPAYRTDSAMAASATTPVASSFQWCAQTRLPAAAVATRERALRASRASSILTTTESRGRLAGLGLRVCHTYLALLRSWSSVLQLRGHGRITLALGHITLACVPSLLLRSWSVGLAVPWPWSHHSCVDVATCGYLLAGLGCQARLSYP